MSILLHSIHLRKQKTPSFTHTFYTFKRKLNRWTFSGMEAWIWLLCFSLQYLSLEAIAFYKHKRYISFNNGPNKAAFQHSPLLNKLSQPIFINKVSQSSSINKAHFFWQAVYFFWRVWKEPKFHQWKDPKIITKFCINIFEPFYHS